MHLLASKCIFHKTKSPENLLFSGLCILCCLFRGEGGNLPKRMQDMNRGLGIIIDRNRKRNQRGTGSKLIGIKSLERCFNPKTKKYNPHLHIIVPNKEMAEIIVKECLELCPMPFASDKAQKIIKIDNTEKH
jgi:hypothetical protein